jgi:hypothetical protein
MIHVGTWFCDAQHKPSGGNGNVYPLVARNRLRVHLFPSTGCRVATLGERCENPGLRWGGSMRASARMLPSVVGGPGGVLGVHGGHVQGYGNQTLPPTQTAEITKDMEETECGNKFP